MGLELKIIFIENAIEMNQYLFRIWVLIPGENEEEMLAHLQRCQPFEPPSVYEICHCNGQCVEQKVIPKIKRS